VARIAADLADTNIYLTSRANLQLRGIDHVDGCVPAELIQRIAQTGLFPSPSHELVRNIVVSPLTGRIGGRADLRDIARSLDELLCADPALARLPGVFWFSLDDGRGDVADRSLDLGLFALDADTAQIRVGSQLWDSTVALVDAPAAVLELARRFLQVRGTGNTALWHIDELPGKGVELLDHSYERDERTLITSGPPAFGKISHGDGREALHMEVPDGTLTPELAAHVAGLGPELIVTPWRSIIVPDLEPA